MRLVILDDYDLASEWAAKYVRNRILQFAPTADKPFVLGLPTGAAIAAISVVCLAIGLGTLRVYTCVHTFGVFPPPFPTLVEIGKTIDL